MGPANNLIYLTQHIAAVMGRQSDQVLQEQLGIGLSQYRILMVLEWSPQVQQRVIADNLGQTEASISRQIKVLQNKGLLFTRVDPNNKRTHITVPTPLGMKITEAASSLLQRNFSHDFSVLGDKQIKQLLINLQSLHKTTCRPGKLGACDHPLGV